MGILRIGDVRQSALALAEACEKAAQSHGLDQPVKTAAPPATGPPGLEPKMLSYRGSMVALMRYHEQNFVREAKKFEIFPRVDYVTGEVAQLQQEGGYEQLAGVKRFREFEDTLENGFEYRRSHFQKGFCEYGASAWQPRCVLTPSRA